MKPTILTLFSFFFFVNFYAQRPKHDWQIQAGLHIVDLYPVGKSSTFFPNQGNFQSLLDMVIQNYYTPMKLLRVDQKIDV